MGSDYSSVRSSCFYGVFDGTYPQDEGLTNYYDYGRFWPYDSNTDTGNLLYTCIYQYFLFDKY